MGQPTFIQQYAPQTQAGRQTQTHPAAPPHAPVPQALPQAIPPQPEITIPTSAPAVDSRAHSPVAPEYSPITPKAQPVLPATIHPPPLPPPSPSAATVAQSSPSRRDDAHPPPPHQPHNRTRQPSLPPLNTKATMPHAPPPPPPPPAANNDNESAEFIPEPAPQPFSADDSTDAIALRAAISSLQFQKKKAQDDLRALETLRGQALRNPRLFRTELEAGRLRENKPSFADWRAVLEAEGSDEEEEEVEGKKDAGEDVGMAGSSTLPSSSVTSNPKNNSAPFTPIPGPQAVVRMPPINWDRYHIVGSGLERLHEVQQRWPGAAFAYGTSDGGRGREHVVAAPFDPWLDHLEASDSAKRADSLAGTPTGSGMAGGSGSGSVSISEHPMETRRASRMH